MTPAMASATRGTTMIELNVNGEARRFDGDPEMPLLWYPRDVLQMTGTKFGCGRGLCGSCTIHVDGVQVQSCVTTVGSAEGKDVMTIEGLSPDAGHAVQKAWMEHNVPQCGYCQSGQIMAAAALLKDNPKPTDDEIDAAMVAIICRCGTYQRIRQAIKKAAEVLS
jgi:isoquinoline 1-oxidoreductase alpha subunit